MIGATVLQCPRSHRDARELVLEPGFRPMLLNPFPRIPYRILTRSGSIWKAGLEEFGAAVTLVMFDAPDLSRELESVTRTVEGPGAIVYAVRRSGQQQSAGFVLLGCRLPEGYGLRLLRRPEPE
jgi:hypothetical protein